MAQLEDWVDYEDERRFILALPNLTLKTYKNVKKRQSSFILFKQWHDFHFDNDYLINLQD